MEDEIQQFEYNLHELERSIDSALDFVEDFEQVVTKDDETFQEDTKSNFEQIQKEVKKRTCTFYK